MDEIRGQGRGDIEALVQHCGRRRCSNVDMPELGKSNNVVVWNVADPVSQDVGIVLAVLFKIIFQYSVY